MYPKLRSPLEKATGTPNRTPAQLRALDRGKQLWLKKQLAKRRSNPMGLRNQFFEDGSVRLPFDKPRY